MRRKRVGAFLLALLSFVLLWGKICPMTSVQAVSSSWLLYQDNIYYTVTTRGEIVIKSARASITEAVIPEEIDGYTVTEIGSCAFKDCTRLTTVVLPETLRKIGEFAFKDCTRLTSLSIPDAVEQVGWGIVQGTPWLAQQTDDFVVAGQGILLAYGGTDAEVIVPDGIRAIGGYAFASCDTMDTLQLPVSLTSIDSFAFDKCSNLKQVEIAEGLKSIGEYAFHWCISLTEIRLPDTVQSVGNHAFSYCKSLESVQLSQSLGQLSNTMFSGCEKLVTLEIPESVTVIYNYAFQDCTALQSIVIPASVQEIGSGVFDGCTALEQLSILNSACRIYDEEKTIAQSADIYGMASSTAHIYAQKYHRDFVALDQIRGDYNGDGKITIRDAFLVLLISSEIAVGEAPEMSEAQYYAADYDGNGDITISDAFGILLYDSKNAVDAS